LRVAKPALQVGITDHQQIRQPRGKTVGNGLQRLSKRSRPDDRHSAAVVHDVCGLGRSQVRVDRHVVEAAAARSPHDRVNMLVVLHDERDRVAFTQPGPAEEVRKPIRRRLERTERHHLRRGVKNGGRLVRLSTGVLTNLHGSPISYRHVAKRSRPS